MTHRTAQADQAADVHQWPPDIEGMRATVARLIGPDDAPDVLPPPADEVAILTSTLRGHLQLLIPEVDAVARKQPANDIPRYCALACIGEAKGKLSAEPRPGYGGAVAYARRLARVLGALCDHYETLGKN
ncbi:DUF6415 family natural product biosynthesis protein [Streptomyces sp. NPDC093060]|uniref:DUF6415 family natural product biosynthesis protein n=1 Tax=Streptomyces sp. NPDC093060 TaxID=3366019 RepID=UPI0037FFC1CD